MGLATAGAVVVIPRREVHTFCNASAEEELVIEFVLDPIGGRGRDEAYFRKLCGFSVVVVVAAAAAVANTARQIGVLIHGNAGRAHQVNNEGFFAQLTICRCR